MKIALCLYGNIRSFDVVFPYLDKHILQKYSPDVFAITWTNTPELLSNKFDRFHPIRNLSKHKNGQRNISVDYVHSIIDRINPVISKVIDTETSDFYNQLQLIKELPDIKKWAMPMASYKNMWSQEQVIHLKNMKEFQSQSIYDLVIMSRWDVIYTDTIDISAFSNSVITIPESFSRMSDFWAVGGSSIINVFSKRFSSIPLLTELPDTLPNFLESVLENNGISWQATNLPINLLNRYF